jgi:hypothetical protein
MSVQINISGTIIDFPSSAQSPNWAPALIEFAQTVAASLGGIVGPYDIAPQVVDILNDNAEHEIQTPGVSLSFPTSTVRSATIRYSVYRNNNDTQTHAESGLLVVVYNTESGDWEIQRDFTGNVTPEGTYGNLNPAGTCTSGILFRIDSNGQMYYKAGTLNLPGYTGKLSFAAQALLQTS